MLQRLRDSYRRFMYGRYGSDQLNIVLLVAAVLFSFLSRVLSLFLRNSWAYACVIWPLLTALSHAAAAGEIGLFRGVQTVVCIWVALNILSAVQRINDCTLAKAVGLTLLGVLGTLIVWALLVLIYIFTAQLGFFGGDLWAEIVSRLYSV